MIPVVFYSLGTSGLMVVQARYPFRLTTPDPGAHTTPTSIDVATDVVATPPGLQWAARLEPSQDCAAQVVDQDPPANKEMGHM